MKIVNDGMKQLIILSGLVVLITGCNGQQSSIGDSSYMPISSHKALSEESSSYRGSQAYNSSIFSRENINGNSGSLGIAKPLINVPGVTKDINLSLNLIYSSISGDSTFHMPKGWDLQLSYVIPGKLVDINGNQYVIDYKWADDSGYKSGLKYVNNHGISFTEVGKSNLKCELDNREYSYIYSDAAGAHQYFDFSGKLIARDNNFGSCISYYYIGSGGVYNTRLDHIIDSYGQEFNFNYGNNNYFTVTSNKKQLVKIYYNSQGVSLYEDAMGYKTYYNYTNDSNPLVSKIDYPSGLATQVQYGSLKYQICGQNGKVDSLPVVKSVIHLGEDGGVVDQTDYAYGDATGGHNFTGYGAGYCLGGDRDGLIDSNDSNYTYNITITKHGDKYSSGQKSRIYYNFLHLAIQTDNLDNSDKAKNQVLYGYDISPEKHLRSASYDQPIKIESKARGITTVLINNTYNEYGRPITSSTQALVNGKLTAYKNTTVSYFKDANYIPQDIVNTDQIKGSTIHTTNTLNKNKTAIANSSIFHDNQPWKAIELSYDNSGRTTTQKVHWSASSNLSGIKDSKVSYTYSYANGELTTVKTDGVNNSTTVKTSTILPGSPTLKQISPSGNTTSYTYDEDGREISRVDPMGYTTTTSYTVKQVGGSNIVAKTNPLGHIDTIVYDALSRALVVKDNGGVNGTERVIRTNTYAINNQLATQTDRFGNTAINRYDELGRVVESTDALNNVTKVEYDDANLTAKTRVNGILKSEAIKDAVQNVLSVTDYSADSQHSRVVAAIFNGFNQKLSSQGTLDGGLDNKINYSYNGDGEVVDTNKMYYDNSTSYTTVSAKSQKDLLGNVLEKTTTVSNKGTIHSNQNTYNKVGQLESSTNLLNQVKTISYNQDGKLAVVKNYNNSTTIYDYDKNGNTIAIKTGQTTTNSTYDAVGHLLSVSGSNGTIRYSYTKAGLLEQISYPDGKTVNYTYDNNDLLTTKTDTFGVTTKYSYDKFGRLFSISMANSTVSYQYADDKIVNGRYGEPVETVLTDNGSNLLSHSYKYDSWGNISEDNMRQNNHHIKVVLVHNQKQELVSKEISSDLPDSSLNMTQNFEYDGRHHLLSSTASYRDESGKTMEVKEHFDYDKNGNITIYDRNQVVNKYTYNELDQLTSVNGNEISYDKAGNMLTDSHGNQYSYNELNQLISVKMKDENVKYDYWATGLLSKKTNSKNGDVVEFYYDTDGNANAISSVTNQVANQDSFMLDSSGKPIVSYRNNNANYYIRAVSSTIGMMNSKGDLTNGYKYDGYGASTSTKATDPAQSFLWDQEYRDQDTKLVFLRNRFHSEEYMRFISADTYPVDNIYNFGNGDPINNIDPSGHLSIGGIVGDVISVVLTLAVLSGIFTGVALIGLGIAALVVPLASTAIDDAIEHVSAEEFKRDLVVGALTTIASVIVGAAAAGLFVKVLSNNVMQYGLKVVRLVTTAVIASGAFGALSGLIVVPFLDEFVGGAMASSGSGGSGGDTYWTPVEPIHSSDSSYLASFKYSSTAGEG